MDLPTILQGVASGLLTGGSAAGTTFLAVFKDIKKRISDLEKKLGSPDDEPASGLFGTVDQLSKAFRSLKNEIDSWRDEPPDWLVRIVQRVNNRGSSTNEAWGQNLEERVEMRLKGFKDSLKRLEEDLERREEKLQDEIAKSSPEFRTFVSRDEYEEDSKRRAAEIRKIQENLKSANGFLRGVMATLGYIDPAPSASDPPPPRAIPRPAPPTPGKPFPPPLKKK